MNQSSPFFLFNSIVSLIYWWLWSLWRRGEKRSECQIVPSKHAARVVWRRIDRGTDVWRRGTQHCKVIQRIRSRTIHAGRGEIVVVVVKLGDVAKQRLRGQLMRDPFFINNVDESIRTMNHRQMRIDATHH